MKRPQRNKLSLLLCLACALPLFSACGDDDGGTDAAIGSDSGRVGDDMRVAEDTGTDDTGTDDTGTDDTGTSDDMGMGDDTGMMGPDWTVRSHPCPGINRTDAFWIDTDGTMWLGCGSGTEGEGLWRSTDSGENWAVPQTSPSNLLTDLRVLSVHRGYNDLLYVGGPQNQMAISLDTSSEPYAAEAVLTRGTQVGQAFLASPFVTTPNGAAFADSLNGHDALYRSGPEIGPSAAEWTDAREWESDGGTSHQILDMVAVGERFVGCGSTIAEPPFVFLPSMEAGAMPWQMTPIQLVSGLGEYDGEMWGVAASEGRVVVVGVDQDNNVGKIFVSGADRYEADDYTQIDINTGLLPIVTGADSSWARGVCMNGDRVIVVGEVQPLGAGDNSGFVLGSSDGGATFVDMTPDGSPVTWSKCVVGSGGRVAVAGAGRIAIFE